ncbi:unnamed protein product [Closterium sp. NIES-64]|nr:unnamed protein product [Closterium sp. NIES-64]
MPRSLRRCAVSVRRRAKEAALREECSVMSWKVRKRERRERSVGSGGASGGEEPGSGGGVGGRPLESAGGALSGARGTAEPAGGALSGARGTAEPAGGALRGARGTAEPAGGALSGARGTAEPAGGALSGARGTAEPAGGLSALVVALDLLIRAKGPLGITKGVKRVMLLTGGGTPLEEASEASNEEQVCGKGGQIDAGDLAPPSPLLRPRPSLSSAETSPLPPTQTATLQAATMAGKMHEYGIALHAAATVAGKMHEYGIALHAVLLSGRVEGEEAEAGGADDDGDPGGERAEARDVAYENEKLLRRFFDAGACRVHGGRREEQEKLKEADDGGRCGKRCKREENGTGDARAEGGGGADEEEEEEKEEEKGVGSGGVVCGGELRVVASLAAAGMLYRVKPRVLPTTSYRGDLLVAPGCTIKVWSYKKTFPQRLPPLKLLSRLAPPSDPSATGDVKMEREYRVVESGADGHGEGGGDGGDGGGEGEEGGGAEGGGGAGEELETVGLDELVRAYKYGPQVIPVSEYDRMANRFQAEKGIQIIGFTMRDQIPRHYFIKDTAILLPEPSNTKAALALSALAQAMESSEKVAIVRFKLTNRADSGVALGVLMPWCRGKRGFTEEEDESVPDLLLFNAIPFSEDIREFSFPSLEAAPPNQQPTAVQSSAAAALVQAMSLVRCSEVGEDDEEYNKEEGVGEDEKLRPEDTPSPALQHYYDFICAVPCSGPPLQGPHIASPCLSSCFALPPSQFHPSHPHSTTMLSSELESSNPRPAFHFSLPLLLFSPHLPPITFPTSHSHLSPLPIPTALLRLHPSSSPPTQGQDTATPCLSSCSALSFSHSLYPPVPPFRSTTTISSELESCTPRPAYPLYLPLVLFTPAHPSHSQSSPPPSQHYYDFIRARVLRPKAPILFSFPLLLFTAPTLPLSEYHSPTLQSLPPSSLQHYYDFIRARVLRPKAPIPPLPAALAAPLSHPLSADHPATRSFAAAFPALGDHTAPLSQQPLQLSQAEPSPDEPAPAAAAPSRPDSPVARDQSRETSAGPSGVTSAGH